MVPASELAWHACRPDGSEVEEERFEPPPDGSVIRLMGDYGVSIPLWGPDGLMFDETDEVVRELGVSPALAADLERWADAWETQSGRPEHDAEAHRLLERLNAKLGRRYRFVLHGNKRHPPVWVHLDIMRTHRLLAFGTSGTLWIGGAVAGQVLTGPVLIGAAAGFVLVGALAVGLAGRRLPHVLAALWFAAVLLLFALLAPMGTAEPSGWPLAAAVSLLYGTLGFVAWAGTAGAILAFLGQITSAKGLGREADWR